MSEDIKEILQILEAMASNDDIAFLPRQASLLLDYITNLQEENEHTNYCNEQLRKKITNLEYKINTLEDYKSRCEKAVELIDEYMKYPPHYITGYVGKKIRNILQGSE